MNSFSQRLKSTRELLHINQKQLEDLCGWENNRGNRVSNYERGFRSPNIDDVAKIAKILNVSTDYLLGVSNEKLVDKKNNIVVSKKVKTNTGGNILNYYCAERSWGDLTREIKNYPAGTIKYPIATKQRLSDNAFAVIVDESRASKEFPIGSILIADPDITKLKSNDYVIVQSGGNDEEIVRFRTSGPNQYLVPLDPSLSAYKLDSQVGIIALIRNMIKSL